MMTTNALVNGDLRSSAFVSNNSSASSSTSSLGGSSSGGFYGNTTNGIYNGAKNSSSFTPVSSKGRDNLPLEITSFAPTRENTSTPTPTPPEDQFSKEFGKQIPYFDMQSSFGTPKYGTLVPNRLFVGGIPEETTGDDLHLLFSRFGNVRSTKVIMDRTGLSKGYGFVTFETEHEAKRLFDAVGNKV